MPAVRPMPAHSTTAPAAVATTAKIRPWAWEMRPEGRGRPAVRAIRASRSRSWTWFSADAPHESSITPRSTTSPWAQGKSAPNGARSMKPAAAETRTRRTMPNFESSAYVPARSTKPEAPRTRATAPSALGGTGRPLDAGVRGHGRPAGPPAPASRVHREPDQRAPECIGNHRVSGAHGRGEPSHDGGDAEGHLEQGQAHGEGGGPAAGGPSSGQENLDEEDDERHPEPAQTPG